MTRPAVRAQFSPESLAYGDLVVADAASVLRKEIDDLAASPDPSVAVQTKIDVTGASSPVTAYDRETEQRIGRAYAGTGVRIWGEENVNDWPTGSVASLDLHVDPIDGTELFINYLDELIAWAQGNRPTRPVGGSVVSAGALRPGSHTPVWGVLAAPFLSPDGIVRWNVGPNEPAVRIEPDGSKHRLPLAADLPAPESGGVVLVSSDSAERIYRGSLEAAGYRVVKLKSAAMAAICAMDPELFDRLRPGELNGDPIVGVAMRTAKNWDIAAVVAIANKLRHFVSTMSGEPRTFEPGAGSAIFAVREKIGRDIAAVLRPYLQS